MNSDSNNFISKDVKPK